MSKIIIIKDKDGKITDCVYNLLEEGSNEKTLEYSHLSNWTKPNKLCSTLIKTDEGWIFHDHFGKKIWEFDFCQFSNLIVLMKLFECDQDFELFKKEKIKNKETNGV